MARKRTLSDAGPKKPTELLVTREEARSRLEERIQKGREIRNTQIKSHDHFEAKWIKKERCKLGTAAIMEKLRAKLQGHFNYYGVSGNCDMLKSFYHQTCRIVFKWLNRRSQRKSCNWQGFGEMLEYYRIPHPKIIGNWN